MTVTEIENNKENTLQQEKLDANASQLNKQNETQNNSSDNIGNAEQVQEDPNWRAFREARKKDREERQIAERKAAEREAEVAALKAAMEAAFSKPTATHQDVYQQHEESEDERIEKKVQSILAQKEAQAERERLEKEQQEYPQRLANNFPDFHHAIAQENLDYLDYHYPEVSKPLQRLPDGYDKWLYIYNAVKKFVPNHSNAKKEAAKANANFNKPKSISSPSISQSGEAISSVRLSEEKRAANWARMNSIIKGVG